MKGKSLKILALFLLVLLTLSCFVACKTTPGDDDQGRKDQGTVTPGNDDPKPEVKNYVEIGDEATLVEVAAKIAANTDGYATKVFKLTADITLTKDFAPITGFTGVFDGQFHTISGLTIDSDLAAVGLFSTLNGATVKNLTVKATAVSNSEPAAVVGMLAGSADGATISCVTVEGTLNVGGNRSVVGGIVATAKNTTLLNVKSTVTLSGAGTVAGGLVGKLDTGAMVVNAYSAATVNATAAAKATAIGTKVADSAVAFVLVNAGEVVGTAEPAEYTPAYIIGCKVGAAASEMGWNAVDWDVSGETPALKADLNKTYTAPVVTLDGNALTAVWGEKLIVTAPTLEAGKAFAGYAVGGDAYYPALPVVNDLALTTVSVDYKALLGKWTPLVAADEALTVNGTLSFGATSLTYKAAAVVDGLPVLLFTDAQGATYRLSVKTLSTAEKASYGISAEGAALLALEKKNETGYDAAKLYMPAPGAAVGAWNIGSNVTIYTADVVTAGTLNAFRSMTVGSAVGTYKTCLAVKDGAITVLADGATADVNAENVPVLKKNGAVCTVATAAYDGEWIAADGKVIVSAGKIGETTLKVVSTANGTGLLDETTGTLYVRALSALTAVKDGASVTYVNGDFSGDWKTVKDGTVIRVTISGDRVYFNGATDPVIATIAPDAQTGVAELTVTVGDKTYVFVHDGIALVSEGLTVYAASAVDALFGNYILGSASFALSDGKLIITQNGVAGAAQDLNLVYSNEVLSLLTGDLTFTVKNGHMTVAGYTSEVTGTVGEFRLFTADELSAVLAALKGNWMARPSGGVKYASLKMSFTEAGVLSFDGTAAVYEFKENGNAIVLSAKCVYEKASQVITLEPLANGLIATSGVSVGAMMPEALAEAIGKYYEFLIGTGAEGEIPSYITLYYDGKLSLSIFANGRITTTTYTAKQYTVATNGTTYVLTVTNAETGAVLVSVTFNADKTLVYDGKTYTNTTFILPKDNYHEVGKTDGVSFKVIEGSVGYWEEDEDDGEEYWEDAVYPLYGFRYTDASGKVYTSESFAWSKANGTQTLSIRVKAADDAVLNLTVSYPEGNDFSKITLKAGDGAAVELYSETAIAEMAGSYANKNHSFSVSTAGLLTLNGEVKSFIYQKNGSLLTYTVDGVDYVIDLTTPEIMKCGDEVFYDARFASFAGIELTDFKLGEATADRLHTLLLTANGFTFDGAKIVWGTYDRNGDNIYFSVKETVSGEEKNIRWKLENGGARTFGICFFPNYDGDWGQRYFIPAALLDADHFYTDGDSTIVTVKQPDYSDGFMPFVFALGTTQYDYRDYSYSYAEGVLTVKLSDDIRLTFAKGEDNALEVKLNGTALSHYDPPSLDAFEMEATQIFGTTGDSFKVEVKNGVITYSPGQYWAKVVEVYSFGKWNGLDVIYFTANSTDWAILLGTNQKPVPVPAKLLGLFGTYTLNGQTVTVAFDTSTDVAAVTVKVGNTAATEIAVSSCNLPYDSQYVISFKSGETVYYVLPDVVNGKGAFLADEAAFKGITRFNLASYAELRIYLTKAADGSLIYVYEIKGEKVTPAAVSGKANIFSVTYGENVTEYYAYFKDAAAKQYMAVPADALELLGTFTATNNKSVTVAIGKNEKNEICYTVVYNGKAAVAAIFDNTAKNLKFAYNDGTDDYTCYLAKGESGVVVTEVNAKQNAFVTGTGSYNGYYTPIKSYCYTRVAFVNGVPTVTYDNKATENVHFNADNTRLYFTQNGVEYCIVMVDSTQTTESSRAVTITAAQAAFVGEHTLNGKKLIVQVKAGYSPALTVSYDGSAVTEVIFHSAALLSFKGLAEDGISPDYKAVVLKDGEMTLTGGLLDTAKLDYQFLGTYGDRGYTLGYKFTLSADGKTAVGASYVLTDSTGAELTYSINATTLVLTVTVGENTKYYAFCTGSTKALAELSAEDKALLGEYTVDGHTVKLSANYTASNRRGYTYTAGYKLTLDNGDPISVTFSKDNGTPAKQYVKFTANEQTYLFFVVEAGVSAKLHVLTAEQVAMMGASYSTIASPYKYLKGSLIFAEDGTFTLGYYFDGKAITDETAVPYGMSFKSSEGDLYYLINGEGVTSPYLLTAAQYAWYVSGVTVGGHTLTIVPGAKSGEAFKVKLDDAATAVTAVWVAGDYPYLKFTVGDKGYVLAHNTTADNALVLTELTAAQASALSFKESYVQIVKPDGTKYTSANLEAVVTVDATGAVSIGFSYGSNPAPTSVEILTEKDGINSKGVVKVVLEGQTYYILHHLWSATGNNYDKVSLTEAQYALMGTWTVDGKTLIIGLNAPNWSAYLMVTYDGTAVTSSKSDVTAGSPCFKNVDGVTVVEFTVGGTTYQASLVSGVMTLTAV